MSLWRTMMIIFLGLLLLVEMYSAPYELFHLSETHFPQAKCLDGSQGSYYFRPGTGSGADKWNIFMSGGGWCWDLQDCFLRSQEGLGSSKPAFLSHTRDVPMYVGVMCGWGSTANWNMCHAGWTGTAIAAGAPPPPPAYDAPADSCPGNLPTAYTTYKFNLDPDNSNTGLRDWTAANSIQLAEVTLYDIYGTPLLDGLSCTNPDGDNPKPARAVAMEREDSRQKQYPDQKSGNAA